MPLITSQIALTFHPVFKAANIDCEVTVGYEIDYYFNAIDRINPFNGFVINQNPFPVKQSSDLSLGGPFVKVSIMHADDHYYDYSNDCHTCYRAHSCNNLCGLYGQLMSSWLKPVSNNDDLVYATLNTEDGSQINQQTCFDRSWNGTYTLGYHTSHDCDYHISFFHLDDQSATDVTAGTGETISSVNASGSDLVTYAEAQSDVTYTLNQGELLIGKWFWPLCNLQILLSWGLRGASLKRIMRNEYTEGIPSLNFETKSNCLESNFRGAGPIFTMEPQYAIHENFQLTGHLATSLLIGHLTPTLDQVNMGTLDESSNTLRTPDLRAAVPVVDASIGLNYRSCPFSNFNFEIEAGYQFAGYFKAINLLFPVFLTGLGQNNSDLKLHGPYLNITLGSTY